MDTDQSLVELVDALDSVWSVVATSLELKDKLEELDNIISKIVNLTTECAIFIREYLGHGFASMSIATTSSRHDTDSHPGRVAGRIRSAPDPKISAMSEALRGLREDFNTGAIIHSAFVSMRTIDLVEALGKFRV